MAKEDTIKQILKEYQTSRDSKIYEAERRKQLLEEKYPALVEINNEIHMVGSKATKAVLLNPAKSAEIKEDAAKQLSLLKEKKISFLNSIGISENYFEPDFNCKRCNDTGYEGNVKCKCFEKKLIELNYKSTHIDKLLNKNNFETFNLEVFSKECFKNRETTESVSAYDRMKAIYKHCLNYCENFESGAKNLIFFGGTGVGKTFMSCCITKALVDRGFTVEYYKSDNLMSLAEKNKFKSKYPMGEVVDIELKYNSLLTCDLLVIDDLGSEYVTELRESELYSIIEHKMINETSFIINTNLDKLGILQKYGSRLYSRIFSQESSTAIQFLGKDIRVSG